MSNKILIIITIFCKSISISAQEDAFITKAIDYLDTHIDCKGDSYIKKDSVAMYAALLSNIFDVELISPSLYLTFRYDEYRKLKEKIKNKDIDPAVMDSIKTNLFSVHFLTCLKDRKIYERIALMHFFDRSLDNHVAHFSQLCTNHFKSIEKAKRFYEYPIRNDGDDYFEDCIQIMTGIFIDPHHPLITVDFLHKQKEWCDLHSRDEGIDSFFLDALTDSMIDGFRSRFVLDD